MRESVATVKVTEALAGEGCPLCALHLEAERAFFAAFFGEMVMDGKSQAELGRHGLCRDHLYLVLEAPDKLGAALALRTLVHSALAKPEGFAGRGCYACLALAEADRRYAEVMGDLFKAGKNGELLKSAAGRLCLPHLAYLLAVNRAGWRAKTASGLEELCREGAEGSLESMAAELEWFIKKFDYRMRDEPWRGTEDIVRRVVEKLAGRKG